MFHLLASLLFRMPCMVHTIFLPINEFSPCCFCCHNKGWGKHRTPSEEEDHFSCLFFNYDRRISPFPAINFLAINNTKSCSCFFPFLPSRTFNIYKEFPNILHKEKGESFCFVFFREMGKKEGKSKHVHFPGRNYKGGREVYFPTEAVSFPQNIRTNGIWKYGHCENFPIFGIYRISKCGNLMHRMTSEVRGKHTFLCMNRN